MLTLLPVCCVVLQAQLVDLKSELAETQGEKAVVEREVHDQLLQLHAMQLQLSAKAGQAVDSDSIKDRMVGTAFLSSLLDWLLLISFVLYTLLAFLAIFVINGSLSLREAKC